MADINDIKKWLEEVLGIVTYDGKINEFVDWITGVDSFTNRSVSGGKLISGSSIRDLIQNRLKLPIIVYDDEQAGLYRLFSSETARDRWISGNDPLSPSYDPEGTAHLEIFNFERPSEFVLSTSISSDPRYIIKGDETSNDSVLSFTVSLKDKDNQTKSDSIVVTYTITNNITGVVLTFSEPYGSSYVNNPENPVTINLYKYLSEGINSVNVNVKAATVSNSVDVGFSVYFISFSLSSSFDFNLAKTAGIAFDIPFEINRSSAVSGSTLRVQAYIDGNIAKLDNNGADAMWNTTDSSSRINGSIRIRNNYAASTSESPHTSHTLRLEATMESGNTVFHSNVLYYTFEIASEVQDIVNKFVNVGVSTPYNKMIIKDGVFMFRGTLYEPFTINWSYYTDLISNNQSIPITWAIKKLWDQEISYKEISTSIGVKNKVNTFTYIPEYNIASQEDAYLVALYNGNEIDSWPIEIEQSPLVIYEASGYDMKLNAYGRSNSAPNKNVWRDEANNVEATFHGITWDSSSGWDENSFFTVGEDQYATINYKPFATNFGSLGRTIEIDFKSELVNDDNDVLIDIGYASAGRITITPVKATVWLNGSEIVSTHYKPNERIKLAFIFNKTVNGQDGNLVYIINNGILEKAAGIGSVQSYVNINGQFKIGGSLSGVRVYIIRGYSFALTYDDAYNNYVYDSDNKAEIISRNDIANSGAIIYEECSKKIDTVLIEGDLSRILDRNVSKNDSETTVNITRYCVSDPTKNFSVVNGMIRKHGQSTLNYPITSLKIWLNKSADDNVNPVLTLSSVQTAMGFNKNRYLMKNGAIPSNKFVLQANYADSSGANNGTMERMIQDTWYGAVIDGEHKLRTAPELFASGEIIHHNDEDLGETGVREWVEGYGSGVAADKTWGDITERPFPYVIRHAPDSFPCAVFYRNTTGGDNSIHFLGQYVFMDDKKSDYVYGERSIYHYYDETDPFCLKIENKDEDKAINRVWNNNNVLRIEVVLLDTILTSYLNYDVQSLPTDAVNLGAIVPCDTIKYDERGNKLNFYWEDYFEMIYPDPDDFTIKVDGQKVKEDKFAPDSLFRQKAQLFLTFLQWITGVAQLNVGTKIPGTRITLAALNAFKATASAHLDLYKLAAYYIFFLRFGLVDSVERNAQLKTYDGAHWHYEPWDMDIAVGNKNNGGFAFDPPMNRDTRLPSDNSIWAYSGRTSTTSNLLWDCLESWDYWMNTVVPKVAQALYDAGLTYDNATRIFDEEYSLKWSEIMYNQSGHYKYVEMRGNDNDWLAWLLGAGISHRHWWLSKSMNYYDAMWSAGDFNNHRVYMAVTKDAHSSDTDLLTIKPTSSTFFKLTQGDGTVSLGTLPATRENPAVWDVSTYSFNKKDPTHIYGATYIEELDLSCFAQKLETLTLTGAYDQVLGAPIKVLNIGIPYTVTTSTQYDGYVSGTRLALSASSSVGDALGNIRTLDITGQQSITGTDSLLYDNNRRTLTDFYAIGTGLTSFVSSRSGNKFNELRLPAMTIKEDSTTHETTTTSVLSSIRMIDSSWQTISFWTTETTDFAEPVDEDEPVTANPATFTNTGIPASVTLIQFEGSTASNLCAAQLVMGWLDSIATKVAADYPSLSGDALEAKVLEVLGDYQLHAENISWGTTEVPILIYYSDLARLAALNHGNNQNANLIGYIKIADQTELTSIQTTQLREWFGESVFNKSNINSGLIIDQELADQYIQVTVGRDAYIDTIDGQECVVLREGHSATLNATKFLLGDDTNIYDWSYSTQAIGTSISIVEGNDGVYRLVANESVAGNYVVTVTASVRGSAITKSVDIHVIGVTYPSDWEVHIDPKNNAQSRKFEASSTIMTSIFGSGNVYQYNSVSNLRDVYVLYNTYQDFEFYVEPVNPLGTTATLKKIEVEVASLDTTGDLARTNVTAFDGDGNTSEMIDSSYLYYTNSAEHNGIVLGTRDAISTTLTRYILTFRVSIGGKTEIRYVNLLLVADNAPVVRSANTVLYNTLATKIGGGIQRHLYKTDLLALDGTLQFPTTSALGSLVSETVDGAVSSIFKYLPYIEVLNMSGCTFNAIDSNITGLDKRVLNLSNMVNLTQLVLTDAVISNTNDEDLIVDVSDCAAIVSIAATGTSAGIKADGNTALTTVTLGSPYYLYLKDTAVINTVSVTSNTNFDEVHIENVNTGTVKGFSIFNNLF